MNTKTRLVRKLHSTRGVSMIMGMVAFLVVCMVALVIVTAALSSARAVADDKQEKQNMLYLTSAEELLKRELADSDNYVTYSTTSPISTVNAYNLCDTMGFKEAFQKVVVDDAAGQREETLYNEDIARGRGRGRFSIVVDSASLPPEAATAGVTGAQVQVEYVMYPKKYKVRSTDPDTEIQTGTYDITFIMTLEGSAETLFLDVEATEKTYGSRVYVWWNEISEIRNWRP